MGHRIKLFVIGPRGFPGVQGGIERFSESLYVRLVEIGYDVTSFAIKRYSDHNEWKGIKFVYAPAPRNKSLEKTVYNFFAAVYCIIKRPDIIHVHSIASGFFIFLMKIFNLKIVARYNSRDYMHGKWSWLGKAVLKFSERQFFMTDHIITNNMSYYQFLSKRSKKKNVSYVPNGVEIPNIESYLHKPNLKFDHTLEFKKFILYVGRITAEKNIQTLIEAFLLLPDNSQKLVIAGDPAHDDNFFNTVVKKYPNANILFVGKVAREDLNWLYANCGLFVIPSFSEGMPNALLEAMSFNCRILASNIPAHVQFQFDTDTYFAPENAGELKTKILQKLSTAEFIDYKPQLSELAWPEIVKKIDSIHHQILHLE
jgi:alpha-maltose-1-phosphate synthase